MPIHPIFYVILKEDVAVATGMIQFVLYLEFSSFYLKGPSLHVHNYFEAIYIRAFWTQMLKMVLLCKRRQLI